MIQTNAALYIGIVTAVTLDIVPDAVVRTEKIKDGYALIAMRKVGDGADARSYSNQHAFSIHETGAQTGDTLTHAARMAGETLGASLKQAG